MSGIRVLGLAMSLAGASGLPAGAARAQTFLDYLFGAPQAVQPPAVYAPPSRTWRRDEGGRIPEGRPMRRDRSGEGERHAGPTGSGFRTLCVRACDGYFWPISYSASSGQFRADEKLCKSSCPGQKVGLYVHRNGQPADDAVSLDDKPITKLKNAFLYRQEYKPECKCQALQTLVAARHDGPSPDAGRQKATPIPAKEPETGRKGRSRPADPEATGSTRKADESSLKAEASDTVSEGALPKRRVRVVGPPFLAD